MAHPFPIYCWINCFLRQEPVKNLYHLTPHRPLRSVHLFMHSTHNWWSTFYMANTEEETGDELVNKPICGLLQVVWWGIILIVMLNSDSKIEEAKHSGGTKKHTLSLLPLLPSYYLWVLKAEWFWRPHICIKTFPCGFPFPIIEFEYPLQAKGPPDFHHTVAASKQLSRWNNRVFVFYHVFIKFKILSLDTQECNHGLLDIATVHPRGVGYVRKFFSYLSPSGFPSLLSHFPANTFQWKCEYFKKRSKERTVLLSGPHYRKNLPCYSGQYP